MPRMVAFVGGINVGGHRVTMDRLRAEFARLGHEDVETFIASGNVVFTTTGTMNVVDMESQIEKHLAAELGWRVPTFVRRAAEVLAIVKFAAAQPFGVIPSEHTHMVALTHSTLDATQRATVVAHSTSRDRFHVHGREVHWVIAGKLNDSAMTLPKLTKLIGRNTTRNISSLTRLADRL